MYSLNLEYVVYIPNLLVLFSMAEIRDPRGKLLLGEAVRLLVQSGANGVAITDFINEYSNVISETLAAPVEPEHPPLKAQMKEALIEALQELSPPGKKARTGLRKQVAVYVAGVKTSLTLRRDLLVQAEQTLGSGKALRELIHQAANLKPESRANRSAWVEEQIQHHLVLQKAETTLTGQAPH